MKIGRQEYKSSALSTSSADVIVVRGKDLCRELIGKVGFTEYSGSCFVVRFHRHRSDACSMRRWSPLPNTAWCQRAGQSHDLCGSARGTPGCSGRGHPGLWLGDPWRRRVRRQDAGRCRCPQPRGGPEGGRFNRDQRAARRAQARPRLRASAAQGRRSRATRLFEVAKDAGLPDLHRKAARQIEELLPADRQGPGDERLSGDSRRPA